MLIEDPPARVLEGPDPRKHHVIVISGRTPYSLKQNSLRLLDFLNQNRVDLANLAYTTTARRQHHYYRAAHSCVSIEDLQDLLDKEVFEAQEPERTVKSPIIFTFTG